MTVRERQRPDTVTLVGHRVRYVGECTTEMMG